MTKIKRILENERGAALLIALGTILILTILAFGLVSLAENDLTLSGREKKYTQALHVAEAGVDKALWQLKRLGTINPSSFQVETSQGTATVSSSKDADEQYKWTITSTGEVSGGIKRVIKLEVFNLSYWNMVMASESLTASGGGVNGTTSVDGPFYVRGNLELTGDTSITKGPLFINDGELILSSNGCSVGTVDEPILLYLEQGYEKKNSNADLFYSSLSYNVPNINLPALGEAEMQDLETAAKNQSVDNKKGYTDVVADESTSYNRKYTGVSSDYYKVIDSNTTVTTPIGSGLSSLVISSSTPSFGDPGTEASPKDDFAWDLSTKTLTVRGTVFVDGPVTISTDLHYQGNGAIVANGDITIENDILASGTGTFPATNCLGLVSSRTIYIDNPSSNSDPSKLNIEAAIFALQNVKVQKTISVKGAILTRNLEFEHPNGHLLSAPDLPGNLPKAMPGKTETVTLVSGWHEGKL